MKRVEFWEERTDALQVGKWSLFQWAACHASFWGKKTVVFSG